MSNIVKNFIFKYNLQDVKWMDLTWLLVMPIININYLLAGYLAESGTSLALELDKEIPFISVFIFPYVYWYIFILLGLVFILSKDRERYGRTLLAIYVAMCICYLFYYFYPVEISRPVIANTTIPNRLVNIIYENDRPLNCFPSIHVLNTYIIMRFTKLKDSKSWFWYTNISGILIMLSTLFIKQHFILDGVMAIALGEVVVLIINKIEGKYIKQILELPYKAIDKIKKGRDITIS
ncbi:phosphatase PAP2 family protein [Clostridium sp.]|uniref:phosphatase PAP2 family protein n=1 Tax=Clostridium sp. TaxID=1506 RepID=UPI001D6040CE|nr:phosphatase PAP2 family protein [Clostridium sp.]MBS5939584.1 phosphatase PAP2 family protein [Clostridium sp.]